jgi:hypothetical protein
LRVKTRADLSRTIAIEEEHLCQLVSGAGRGSAVELTSNLERNSSMPALSPVRYVGCPMVKYTIALVEWRRIQLIDSLQKKRKGYRRNVD